jgi:hypothetical protein
VQGIVEGTAIYKSCLSCWIKRRCCWILNHLVWVTEIFSEAVIALTNEEGTISRVIRLRERQAQAGNPVLGPRRVTVLPSPILQTHSWVVTYAPLFLFTQRPGSGLNEMLESKRARVQVINQLQGSLGVPG